MPGSSRSSSAPPPSSDRADEPGPQTLADVGEFELIRIITKGLNPGPQVLLGPGDDAAVLAVPGGKVVVSTDVLVEGVHFRHDWSTGFDVGRKAVAASVADLEAMGAAPLGLVVGFSAPASTPMTWVRSFSQGLQQECETAGISLVGGDITGSEQITLSMTVLGSAERAILRSGASPGEVVALRGRLGWSAAGLAVLGRGFRSPRAVVEAHKTPETPYGAGVEAARAGATAMIDVSDGLLADLGHIARASSVAIDVDTATLEVPEPIRAVAAATGQDPLGFLLTGGEDHALAACFAPERVPQGWAVLGRVRAGEGVTVDGETWDGAAGFDHFG